MPVCLQFMESSIGARSAQSKITAPLCANQSASSLPTAEATASRVVVGAAAQSPPRGSALRLFRHDDALDLGNVAVLLAANVVLEPNLGMQVINEARAPGLREYFGVRHRDQVFQGPLVHFPYLLDRGHHVGMRCARRVEKSLLVESPRLDRE